MRTHADGNQLTFWLSVVLVLAVLTIAIYSATSDHTDVSNSVPTTEPNGDYVPDEIRGLLSFVDSMTARGATSGGHEFTAAGIRYVAAALGTVANSSDLDIGPELEMIRNLATRIERDPRPRERTAQARLAFRTLAALFEGVQYARFRGLEPDVANVSRAASSLRAGYRLIDQNDVVQEFFSRAASTIRTMNKEMSSPRRTTAFGTA